MLTRTIPYLHAQSWLDKKITRWIFSAQMQRDSCAMVKKCTAVQQCAYIRTCRVKRGNIVRRNLQMTFNESSNCVKSWLLHVHDNSFCSRLPRPTTAERKQRMCPSCTRKAIAIFFRCHQTFLVDWGRGLVVFSFDSVTFRVSTILFLVTYRTPISVKSLVRLWLAYYPKVTHQSRTKKTVDAWVCPVLNFESRNT